MTTLSSLLPALVGTLLTFAAAWFWFQKTAIVKERDRLALEADALDYRVRQLESEQAVLRHSITPINAAMQALLIKELTHFHTPRMDALLQKLGPPITLTDDEETELASLLIARERDLNGRISDSERDAALMLPMIIKRVRAEAVSTGPTETIAVEIPCVAAK